jgi:hypothetical protein
MLQTEDRRKDLGELVNKFRSGGVDSCLGNAGLGREIEGLLDREGGEVNVVLWTILYIATVMPGNLVGGEGVVMDIPLD